MATEVHFVCQEGKLYFRTGDIGVRRLDGTIAVVERISSALKLAQGEFIYPERLEGRLESRCPAVRQCYIWGKCSERYIVAVVVPWASAEGMDAEAVQHAVAATGHAEGFASWEIPQAILLESSGSLFSIHNGLLTSTGKRRRAELEKRYRGRLEDLYSCMQENLGVCGVAENPFKQVPDLFELLQHVLPRASQHPSTTTRMPSSSFVGLGGDSLAAMRLCGLVEQRLRCHIALATLLRAHSMAAVEAAIANARAATAAAADGNENGQSSLGRSRGDLPQATLAAHLCGGAGDVDWAVECALDEEAFLADLEQTGVSNLLTANPFKIARWSACEDVLLTGATGFLGPFLLQELLKRSKALSSTVFCIVRAPTDGEAMERLRLHATKLQTWESEFEERVVAVSGDVSLPRMGLSAVRFAELAHRVVHVVHNAAKVHGILSFRHLKAANVGGSLEALRFAALHRAKCFHHISSINVLRPVSDHPERGFDSAEVIATLIGIIDTMPGYAQSKAIAEVQVNLAAAALRRRSSGGGNTTCLLPLRRLCIYRPATISAHSTTGCGNIHCFTTDIIRGLASLHAYPDETESRCFIPQLLLLTPVDYVASATAALALHDGLKDISGMSNDAVEVYHLVTPHPLPWRDLRQYLSSYGLPLRAVSQEEWVTLLSTLPTSSPLLVFRDSLLAGAVACNDHGTGPSDSQTVASLRALQSDVSAIHSGGAPTIVCPAVTCVRFRRFLRWLSTQGLFPTLDHCCEQSFDDAEHLLIPKDHAFYRVEGWYSSLRDITFLTALRVLEDDHLETLRLLRHAVRAAELAERQQHGQAESFLPRAQPSRPEEYTLRVCETGVVAHSGFTGQRFVLEERRVANEAARMSKHTSVDLPADQSGDEESVRARRRRLRNDVLCSWRDHGSVSEVHRAELFDEVLGMLADAMTECGADNGVGAFVRLSTRSPKDALDELRLLGPKPTGTLVANRNGVPWFMDAWARLRVFSADDAADLFLASERVVEDIRAARYYGFPTPQLVVRRWARDMNTALEFRLFVSNSALTAACSYHADCYVEGLMERRRDVECLLHRFWTEAIRPRVLDGCHSFAVDVVLSKIPEVLVVEEASADECLRGRGKPPRSASSLATVIEVNYPPPIASTILFDWSKAEDRRVLLEGPFELRLVSEQTGYRELE
eukprot:TRINITY_DN67956_c0_g1_i1.p1 TRINITY_DN67956_c0_g1~~TRINITY_DN67956_c0_g1_i1.p1  ORF type:complete len:1372 (+),score=148.41 TRINITY_DN67956_c0_g1_i1:599-4117(+)